MAIYSGFTHKKWWFSIAMLVYQRVREVDLLSYFARKLSVEKPTRVSRAVRATSFMSHRVGNVKSSLDPALCPVHWTLPRQWLVCWSLRFFSSKVLKDFETKLLLTWPICFFLNIWIKTDDFDPFLVAQFVLISPQKQLPVAFPSRHHMPSASALLRAALTHQADWLQPSSESKPEV